MSPPKKKQSTWLTSSPGQGYGRPFSQRFLWRPVDSVLKSGGCENPSYIMGFQLPVPPSTGEFAGFLNHQQYFGIFCTKGALLNVVPEKRPFGKVWKISGHSSFRCPRVFSMESMVVEMVPIKGGRDYITPQKAIYKWYILPIGGLYATYHPLQESEKSIDPKLCLNIAQLLLTVC